MTVYTSCMRVCVNDTIVESCSYHGSIPQSDTFDMGLNDHRRRYELQGKRMIPGWWFDSSISHLPTVYIPRNLKKKECDGALARPDGHGKVV
jgi:hypothetical protein